MCEALRFRLDSNFVERVALAGLGLLLELPAPSKLCLGMLELPYANGALACLSFRMQMGREGVYEHHWALRGTLEVERADSHLFYAL